MKVKVSNDRVKKRGKMEGWKIGRMEDWKDGRPVLSEAKGLEDWKIERLALSEAEGLAGRRVGVLEDGRGGRCLLSMADCSFLEFRAA
jgi:hypothetical protein